MDVEGAELKVLKGCHQLLTTQSILRIQFEISMEMIRGMEMDGAEIFRFLSDFGYECYPISASGNLLKPVNNTDKYFANFIALPRSS